MKSKNYLCNISEKYWLELGLATQQEYKVSVIQEGIYDAKMFCISWIYIKEKKKGWPESWQTFVSVLMQNY